MPETPDSTLAGVLRPNADLQRENAELRRTLDEALHERDEALHERDEALQRETATSEVLQVINSSGGDLGPVFDAMLEKALHVCEASFGTMFLYDGGKYRSVAVRGAPEFARWMAERGAVEPTPGSRGDRVKHGEKVVHIVDASKEAAYESSATRRAAVEIGGFRTLLAVALRKGDDPLGGIIVYRREVRPFTDKQIALLQNFATQAVIAMENARLINETREALEQQTATAEGLQVINASPGDLTPVFDAMLERAMRLCEARFGFLALYDGDAYTMAASRNVPEALDRALHGGPHRLGRHTALGRVAETKAPVHLEDVRSDIAYLERDPWRAAAVEEGGARAQVVVPLLKKGDLIGAFIIYRQEPRRFTDNQIALVANFADQAVIAIENARLINETREALEQQTATSELLQVINSSPGDLAPVFDAMLDKATRLCEAAFGILLTYDGARFRHAAMRSVPAPYAEFMRENPPIYGPETGPARILAGERVVHVVDMMTTDVYRLGDPNRRAQ